jgi:hypothetical protein
MKACDYMFSALRTRRKSAISSTYARTGLYEQNLTGSAWKPAKTLALLAKVIRMWSASDLHSNPV